MLFDRIGAKNEAKRSIRESRPSPILVTLLYLLLTTGVSTVVQLFTMDPFGEFFSLTAQGYDVYDVMDYVFGGGRAVLSVFVSLLLTFYNTVMGFGYSGYTLSLSRGEEGSLEQLFDGFSLAFKVIVLSVLTTLITFAWSLLFVVPGILAAFSYSQAVFCLLDDPDISPLEALRRSRQLMRGRRFDLFTVEVSFLGWILLSLGVSSGIAFLAGTVLPEASGTVESVVAMLFDLWLLPYQGIVLARFYSDLAREEETYGPRVEF